MKLLYYPRRVDFDEWLDEFSREQSVDYYDVADLKSAGDFIFKQGGINVKQYPIAISMGILLLDIIHR